MYLPRSTSTPDRRVRPHPVADRRRRRDAWTAANPRMPGYPPNDYFVVNDNPRQRVLLVAATSPLTVLDHGWDPMEINARELAGLPGRRPVPRGRVPLAQPLLADRGRRDGHRDRGAVHPVTVTGGRPAAAPPARLQLLGPQRGVAGLIWPSMMRRRWPNGQNADFMALIVSHSISSQPKPNASTRVEELVAHVDVGHQPVVGIDRDPVAEPGQQPDGVLGDGRRRGPGVELDVGNRVSSASPGLRPRTQPAGPSEGSAARPSRTVMSSTMRTPAEALGAAQLQGLPDRRQAERLAGVDRDLAVGPGDLLERGEVPGRRVAGLAAGDVEADDARVAVAQRQSAISLDLAAWRIAVAQGTDGDGAPGAAEAEPPSTASTTSSRVSPPSMCSSGAKRTSA